MNKFMFPSRQFLLAVGLMASLLTQAQNTSQRNQKWEIGLSGGMAAAQSDVSNRDLKSSNITGGLLLRYHLDNNIALRGNIVYAELSGDDNKIGREDRGFNFSTPLIEGSLMAELDFLGKRRFKSGQFRRTFSPYIFGGVGYAFADQATYYNELENVSLRPAIELDKANQKSQFLNIPMGIGVKYDVSPNWIIGLEAGIRFLFNDYLDGVSQAGNTRRNDTYTLTHITATYRFDYVADTDRDGIPDSEDACPMAKGGAATKGCPDQDGDGIADAQDGCPTEKGWNSTNGCPDSDGDGIQDKTDKCPDQKGSIATFGCPDSDKDGLADAQDRCPEAAGPTTLGGCPDKDGDGITDLEDECPTTPGLASLNGCPDNDKDRDGVTDDKDLCPTVAGKKSLMGCPDQDNDGVADAQDKCPEVKGTVMNGGCPEINEEDKKVLTEAIYGVQFEPAKSTLKKESYPILDKAVEVLRRNTTYNVSIEGHTDSKGSDVSNQKLSEARAKACYDYFLLKGIPAQRMSFKGFGETKPVADNNTEEGRSKNRRVEFNVLLVGAQN